VRLSRVPLTQTESSIHARQGGAGGWGGRNDAAQRGKRAAHPPIALFLNVYMPCLHVYTCTLCSRLPGVCAPVPALGVDWVTWQAPWAGSPGMRASACAGHGLLLPDRHARWCLCRTRTSSTWQASTRSQWPCSKWNPRPTEVRACTAHRAVRVLAPSV